MPELIAKTTLQEEAPFRRAGLILSVVSPGPISQVALFPGEHPAALAVLQAAGFDMPEPGRFTGGAGGILAWNGRDQALLIGAEPPAGLADLAALSGQSGGYGYLTLRALNAEEAGEAEPGPAAAAAEATAGQKATEAVLSRLVSSDLRLSAFPAGSAARTALNHVPLLLLRRAPDRFDLLVPRSMARTAWRELCEVLEQLAARSPGQARIPGRAG